MTTWYLIPAERGGHVTTIRGGQPSKGPRKQVALRVPVEAHAKLLAIKQATDVDVNEQLLPYVLAYVNDAYARLADSAPSTLFEEAAPKSA